MLYLYNIILYRKTQSQAKENFFTANVDEGRTDDEKDTCYRRRFDLELGDADLSFADSNYDFRLDTELGEVEINGRSAASADYQRGSVIISVENSCGDISVSC